MAKTKNSGARATTSRATRSSQTAQRKKSASRSTAARSTGCSGTPLVKKLGIKSDSILTLLGEPADFLNTLGSLPPNVKIRKTAIGSRDLTVWFPRNLAELQRRIKPIAAAVETGGLWIAWPKKSAGIESDLTEDAIRELGLAEGIVDHKICAIDDNFSGLRFAKRKK